MNAAWVFWALSVTLMGASFIKNGGWNGRQFKRWQSYDAADRLLFLAWGMMLCAIMTYVTEGLL